MYVYVNFLITSYISGSSTFCILLVPRKECCLESCTVQCNVQVMDIFSRVLFLFTFLIMVATNGDICCGGGLNTHACGGDTLKKVSEESEVSCELPLDYRGSEFVGSDGETK